MSIDTGGENQGYVDGKYENSYLQLSAVPPSG